MSSQEYDEILGSLQEIVRRAYALGRKDALRHVIQVMQADEEAMKPLALAAPAEAAMKAASPRDKAGQATVSDKPWWARNPR